MQEPGDGILGGRHKTLYRGGPDSHAALSPPGTDPMHPETCIFSLLGVFDGCLIDGGPSAIQAALGQSMQCSTSFSSFSVNLDLTGKNSIARLAPVSPHCEAEPQPLPVIDISLSSTPSAVPHNARIAIMTVIGPPAFTPG
ncbi:hypothetical protein BV22DRAFT_1134339 [Leucogyrophana mollusca]|uniref:Uncharacterized protein n=1 Tax=Leucogyrophana mollusca TaxID=85980 RepID=A0ACB8B0S2_9AGAM|nr:hypothetical protein BV22DRAFT_1134339 [Leucogyrophana mollusca]